MIGCKRAATELFRGGGGGARMNVVIDVFCCGLKTFYVQILQNVVLSNGGSIIAQRDLHDSTFFPTLLLAAHRCSEIIPSLFLAPHKRLRAKGLCRFRP